MSDRSTKAEVRNPILALPAAKQITNLDEDQRAALRALLIDLRDDARERAAKAWASHKAPMACYWKAVSVYANHIGQSHREGAPVKIYRNHGRYHLRQSDAGKGFATIEVPFGASPKEAFVDWLNETFAAPPAATEAGAEPAAEARGIAPTSEPEAASTPLPPPPAHGGIDGQAVMEWALDRATNAEIENLFAALGARLRAAHRRAPA